LLFCARNRSTSKQQDDMTKLIDNTNNYNNKNEIIYSLIFVEPPLILPVRLAAIRPTFLPAGELRATVVA